MLRIAVNNQSISWHDLHTLLSEANIKFPYNSNNIVIKSNNFPAELVNVDDNSIPEIVYKGIADIGFCMEHVLTNFGITKFAEYKKIGINKRIFFKIFTSCNIYDYFIRKKFMNTL